MTLRLILFSIALSLFFACSRGIHPSGGLKPLVIYPSPPDTTRIQFLERISSSVDVEGRQSGFKKFILGKEDEKSIGKPYGVAINNGKIYLCDALIRGLEIIDLKKGKFEYFKPAGLGELKTPLNCALDKQGYLFVADADRRQIVVFNDKLEYFSSFGEKDNFKPTDVFISGDKIYVSNITGHQVQVYSNDSAFRLLSKFPEIQSDSSGYLFSPINIFVTENRVYVTDFGDFKVKIYTPEGKFIESVGSYGDRLGQFARPKGIAVDRESNLYVVDAGFENTQIFDKNGKLLMFFGGSYKGPGDMWLPAKVTIDYDNLTFFEKYVDPRFKLKYLILVTNQFGPDKLNIYGYVEPNTTELKVKEPKTR
jgi:sugar lactone lactonase YvrE